MTKKYLNGFIILFFLFFSGVINAQKSKTVVFKTSAQCGMCKERIEEVMNFVPGVKYAELNLEDMSLEIKYNTKKDLSRILYFSSPIWQQYLLGAGFR